ncbi:hypothetical protein DPMN_130960 [Dreissena polymorpha]|uniref:Uncharacterized protein n=1 Tax=Dreissena polymorpha TaxID=45954 RepID=A0A9D4H620_DREPO|nr:hypothetical protein DPMN_130960 [Dreissena polymorpha]
MSLGGCALDDNDLSAVCDAFKNGIQLSMLKLSANRITDAGVTHLVDAILKNKSPLAVLDLSNNRPGRGGGRQIPADEGPMVEIYSQLAKSLAAVTCLQTCPRHWTASVSRLTSPWTGSQLSPFTTLCRLLASSREPVVQLGEIIGSIPTLGAEWNMITGSDRPTTDTPSWLKIASQRDRCIYISNLPGNATLQKLESMLEMDADCSVEETCLMKDPVTRSINGVGWCVMGNQESVKKAITYFNNGEVGL